MISGSSADDHWIVVLIRWVGRVAIAATFLYVVWRYGGVQAIAVRDAAMALLITTSLAMAVLLCSRRAVSVPSIFLLLGGLWVVYATVQLSPSAMGQFQNQWRSDNLQRLVEIETVAADLGSVNNAPVPFAAGSIAVGITLATLTPFILCFCFVVNVAVFFNTPSSRLQLGWLFVANALCLSVWGIIQRSSGDRWILPGIEYDGGGVPFASFGYKNAGAAAMVPGLAFAIAMLISRVRQVNRFRAFDTFNLWILAAIFFIGAGMFASLSRGAWLSIIAAAFVLFAMIRARRLSSSLTTAALTLGAIALMLAITGLGNQVLQRFSALSPEHVKFDQRWQHWQDGLRAAAVNLPFGSGLGTYGYASLPVQNRPYGAWFDRAHNQYLETLVESGVVGVLVLIGLIVWSTRCCLRLIRLGRQRHKCDEFRWAIVAVFVLIFAIIQSIFDFALMMTANLMAFGCILAIAELQLINNVQQSAPIAKKIKPICLVNCVPIVVTFIALIASASAYAIAAKSVQTSVVLEATHRSGDTQSKTAGEISEQIDILDQALEADPTSTDLYLRRATYHFAQYRRELVASGREKNVKLEWSQTSPEFLNYALNLVDLASRQQLRDSLLANQSQKQALGMALSDISSALRCNPFRTRELLLIANLAPLIGIESQPWIAAAHDVSKNGSEFLFQSGLSYYSEGNVEKCVECWKQSLMVNQNRIESIYKLAIEKLPKLLIAAELVPDRRPDLFLRLLGGASISERLELGQGLVTELEKRDGIAAGVKHSTVAKIHEYLNQDDLAGKAWVLAVRSDGKNLNYRFGYATYLVRAGRLEEAIDQATLARSIDTQDARFAKLEITLRDSMRSQQ